MPSFQAFLSANWHGHMIVFSQRRMSRHDIGYFLVEVIKSFVQFPILTYPAAAFVRKLLQMEFHSIELARAAKKISALETPQTSNGLNTRNNNVRV